MAIRIVQLGSPRKANEVLRIGTVRRPPRGVPKEAYSRQNWYDIWLPELAPSEELLKKFQLEQDDEKGFSRFSKRYQSEMNKPEKRRLLDLFARLSHLTNFSVGCYCEYEERCHRSILRELLLKHGAKVI
jgi:uncharacterized protein YeaO (DUF488 family)